MPDVAGLVGRVLMAASTVLVAAAILAVLPRLLGVRRRALALRLAVAEGRREGRAGLARLRAERAETAALLVPWRRLHRWVRHPLVVAAVDWYRRRRRSRR